MQKVSGVLLLLIYICVAATLLNERFVSPFNVQNLMRWSSLYGIIGIGAAFAIITGGIDLSIGSVIGLVGCSLPMMLAASQGHPPEVMTAFLIRILAYELIIVSAIWLGVCAYRCWLLGQACAWRTPIQLAVAGVVTFIGQSLLQSISLPAWFNLVAIPLACLTIALHIGLIHGLLITKLRLQPFIVTLCGLLVYRGLARQITGDRTQGFGDEFAESLSLLAVGKPCTIATLLVIAGTAITLWSLLRLAIRFMARRKTSDVGLSISILVLGISLAIIGSSRFWHGYEVDKGEEVANIFGVSLATWSVSVEKEDRERPAALMKQFGWWMFHPAWVWLLAVLLIGTPRSKSELASNSLQRPPPKWTVVIPITGLIIAILLVRRAVWIWEQPTEADEGYLLDHPTWDTRLKMTMVFLSLGLVFAMIGWFFGSARNIAGRRARGPLLLLASAAILWLAGQSPLGQTKVPTPFLFLLTLGFLANLLLTRTIWGRYLLALGHNEQAARFSGINTDRMVILAYLVCGLFSGIGGILFALDANLAEPSALGNFGELYAIAAAVLGGCSLRGGEGSILGVILGASVMRAIISASPLIGIPSQMETVIIGLTILIGVIVDELVKRAIARRRARIARS